MRNLAFFIFVFVATSMIVLIASSSGAQSAVPMLINYQGELHSPATGKPMPDGAYNMLFRIFGEVSGGAPLWTGTHSAANGNPVQVTNGTFSLILGSGPDNALDASVFKGGERWVEIEIGTETLSPRQRVTSVAYSLVSENSRLLDGNESSAFIIQSQGLRLQPNAISPNIIGAYVGNCAVGGVVGATIAGGGCFPGTNWVGDDYGTVGGGEGNYAGEITGATSDEAYATVGGGWYNAASGPYATVGGGGVNGAYGSHATVGGGDYNGASGFSATVPGGWLNEAIGDQSFAAGTQAHADGDGSFVWGDSNPYEVHAWGDNQFVVRATGGFWLITEVDGTGYPIEGVILWPGTSSWDPIGTTTLSQLSQDRADRIEELETENTNLNQRIDDLESRLAALEALIQQQGGVQR